MDSKPNLYHWIGLVGSSEADSHEEQEYLKYTHCFIIGSTYSSFKSLLSKVIDLLLSLNAHPNIHL